MFAIMRGADGIRTLSPIVNVFNNNMPHPSEPHIRPVVPTAVGVI